MDVVLILRFYFFRSYHHLTLDLGMHIQIHIINNQDDFPFHLSTSHTSSCSRGYCHIFCSRNCYLDVAPVGISCELFYV